MTERYISTHRRATAYEREVLEIMQEECAEIIVQISKALRFGLTDGYPGRCETNRQAIGREIGDFEAICSLAVRAGLFNLGDVKDAHEEKLERLARYMQTTPSEVGP